ncbi:MAG: phosphohydrolase [Pseudomonadota bacterium]
MNSDNLRAWVRLPSGRRLDLLNPTPFDWDDEDLAIGLARTYRWGGHSAWPLPLSVAQHSLTVLALSRAAAKTGLAPQAELRELLHDADEGLLGFDAISVIKPFLGEGFHALAGRLQDVVFQRYALAYWTAAEKDAHKRVDRIAAASEALHVAGWDRTEVRQVLKISYKPLDTDPLVAIYGGTAWEPWAPDLAAERFLKELQRIQKRR